MAQFRRNQTVMLDDYDGRGPRLAQVRSVKPNGTVNVKIAMYRTSNTFTDYVVNASRLTALNDTIDRAGFRYLATSFPSERVYGIGPVEQREWDACYPELARLRKSYGPVESVASIMARVRSMA